MTEELPASRLGTKEHWDLVYERETKEYEVGQSSFGLRSLSVKQYGVLGTEMISPIHL